MVKKTIKRLPHKHQVLISALLAGLLLLIFIPSEPASASRADGLQLELGKRYTLELALPEVADHQPGDEPEWQHFTVRKGDNLARLFKRVGLSPQQTYQVSRMGGHAKRLLKMMPGDTLSLVIDGQQLGQLRYQYSTTDSLHIARDQQGELTASLMQKQLDTRINFAMGEITSSFWQGAVEAGLTDNQIMSLAGLFGWDIDFALEIRKGDRFNVLFEEEYLDGEFVGYGEIVAAQFVNQGDTYTAIRHSDGHYYTPEGRSMRKSFLRAPVNFKYISSNFKKRRLHPVTKRWKAHRGVDYAAAVGTPVVAAGDGKVVRATYDRFNGHHVFIQHGEKYQTKYLHFSKRAVKVGQQVKQGQVIGYVGATGQASGPHLHYEFLVDGVHRNPRTVSLPKARPIAKKDAKLFQQQVVKRLQQLQMNQRIMLAMN